MKGLRGDSLSRLGKYAPNNEPIDRQAAADVFQRSEEPWAARNNGAFSHSCVAPLPMLPAHFLRATERENLARRVGEQFGRLTVVGLSAIQPRGNANKGMLSEFAAFVTAIPFVAGVEERRRYEKQIRP